MSKFSNKAPEKRKLERLAQNTNEALVPGCSFRWFGGWSSVTDAKDFGMNSRKIRRVKR